MYSGSLRSARVGLNGVDSPGGQELLIVAVRQLLLPALLPVGLILAASFTGALVSGVAQSGGVQINPEAMKFKFAKLNPVTNLGNLFSLRSATRVAKSFVPAAVMVVLGWGALKALVIPMPVMSLVRLPATFSTAYRLALDAAWVTLAWSGLDYAIEWRSWNTRLKMTKQEGRQEMKEAMGNPQVKGRIRQVQMAMSLDPDTIATKLRRVSEQLGGVNRISLQMTNPRLAHTDLLRGIELLGTEVAPQVAHV